MNFKAIIQASILTWEKDSNELFDYDSKSVSKSLIKTETPSFLLRNGDDLEFSSTFRSLAGTSGMKYILKVHLIDKNFAITPVSSVNGKKLRRDHFEKTWLVVRALKNSHSAKGYRLAEGDVIKLGKLKFRVKEISSTAVPGLETFSMSDMLSQNQSSEHSEEPPPSKIYKLPCRICLSESNDDDNPLIAPCKCDGTMKYIHIKCLQQCLRSKITSRYSDCSVSFVWKKLCCDLCKKEYPYKFILGQKVIELLDIPKPPGQYIILEGLCKDKTSNKSLHVVSLCSKSSIKIGRSQECDLRAQDISVSRTHAMLNYAAGHFYLEDSGGKFGTLIQIKRPISLAHKITIQAGRSIITFSMKKQFSIIPSCFRPISTMIDSYLTPQPEGNLPLLPYNTGIPLSVNNPYDLLESAGLCPHKPDEYSRTNNVLFEHKQLGLNSSYEDEEGTESGDSVEEVKLAISSDEEDENEEKRFDTSAI
ncbi:unnamed protein product [Blepharisma stoltei]|uniref:FHA domain-containing protein n=1 Tax=Blepharisma stoltei TaxID=1481888 RepID=A0AAU9JJZ6_9CILI|nr:unnamed protein product [Blepharisma stoltei]